MAVLVTDTGFETADVGIEPLTLEHLRRSDTGGHTVEVPGETEPDALSDFLNQTVAVRIRFAQFADGRGFSLARQLRLAGYKGRLIAVGPLLADQYPNARRSGFDAVEIPDAMAARQPQAQWLARAGWAEHDYQGRLRKAS